MPESIRDKALRAISEERLLILKANNRGIAAECTSSHPDPDTLIRRQYRAMLWTENGAIRRECECPAPKRCYHLDALELLWKPGPHERSAR